MDYPFFIGKLFDTTAEELAHLQRTVEQSDYAPSTYFFKQKHIDTGRIPVEQLPVTMLDRLESLGLMRSQLVSSACNIVRPNGVVFDHSDIEGDWPNSYRKAHRHIVHIPVYNAGAAYAHRRSRSEKEIRIRMELGSVYLFNNYAPHAVYNIGAPRYNILLDYEDLDWSVKDRLMAQFKVAVPERYQAKRINLYPVIGGEPLQPIQTSPLAVGSMT